MNPTEDVHGSGMTWTVTMAAVKDKHMSYDPIELLQTLIYLYLYN